jgi:hypothetical protein
MVRAVVSKREAVCQMMTHLEDVGIQRRCKGCTYPLDNLPESRCPECGRPFEPGNAETYLLVAVDTPRRRATLLFGMFIGSTLAIDSFLFFVLLRYVAAWGATLLLAFHAVLIVLGFIAGMDEDHTIQRIGIVALLLGAWPFAMALLLFVFDLSLF